MDGDNMRDVITYHLIPYMSIVSSMYTSMTCKTLYKLIQNNEYFKNNKRKLFSAIPTRKIKVINGRGSIEYFGGVGYKAFIHNAISKGHIDDMNYALSRLPNDVIPRCYKCHISCINYMVCVWCKLIYCNRCHYGGNSIICNDCKTFKADSSQSNF